MREVMWIVLASFATFSCYSQKECDPPLFESIIYWGSMQKSQGLSYDSTLIWEEYASMNLDSVKHILRYKESLILLEAEKNSLQKIKSKKPGNMTAQWNLRENGALRTITLQDSCRYISIGFFQSRIASCYSCDYSKRDTCVLENYAVGLDYPERIYFVLSDSVDCFSIKNSWRECHLKAVKVKKEVFNDGAWNDVGLFGY